MLPLQRHTPQWPAPTCAEAQLRRPPQPRYSPLPPSPLPALLPPRRRVLVLLS